MTKMGKNEHISEKVLIFVCIKRSKKTDYSTGNQAKYMDYWEKNASDP